MPVVGPYRKWLALGQNDATEPAWTSTLSAMRAARPADGAELYAVQADSRNDAEVAAAKHFDATIELVAGNIWGDVAYFRIIAACAFLAAPPHAQLCQRFAAGCKWLG